jgi:phosphonate C-P lyase system protein PhnG
MVTPRIESGPADSRTPCPLKAALQPVIAAVAAADLQPVLDRLWASGRFSVERAPRPGLVMCTMLDPFDTAFYLGEILVTRADVALDARHRGCAVVQGDAPEAALLLAAVEAAERGGAALLDGLSEWAGELRERRDAERAREARCSAATRVRFESMRKERVDFGSLGG